MGGVDQAISFDLMYAHYMKKKGNEDEATREGTSSEDEKVVRRDRNLRERRSFTKALKGDRARRRGRGHGGGGGDARSKRSRKRKRSGALLDDFGARLDFS